MSPLDSAESAADRSAPATIALRVVAIAVVLFVLLGALLPQRGLFVVLRADGPIRSLSVTVVDPTGVVIGVEAANAEFSPIPITGVPGRPNALVYRWDGGACDRATTISVGPRNGEVTLSRTTETTHAGSGCTLEAISRSVVLEFREPIDPASVVDLPERLF